MCINFQKILTNMHKYVRYVRMKFKCIICKIMHPHFADEGSNERLH